MPASAARLLLSLSGIHSTRTSMYKRNLIAASIACILIIPAAAHAQAVQEATTAKSPHTLTSNVAFASQY